MLAPLQVLGYFYKIRKENSMLKIIISKNNLNKAYQNKEYFCKSEIAPNAKTDNTDYDRILLEIMLENYTPIIILQEVA